MFHWIITLILAAWVFICEVRIQALKEDSDDHNDKIARQDGQIKDLEKGK